MSKSDWNRKIKSGKAGKGKRIRKEYRGRQFTIRAIWGVIWKPIIVEVFNVYTHTFYKKEIETGVTI